MGMVRAEGGGVWWCGARMKGAGGGVVVLYYRWGRARLPSPLSVP